MTQWTHRNATVNSIMRAPEFRHGMADYHAGKPIPEVMFSPSIQEGYERGRLFACLTGIKYLPMRRGRVDIKARKRFFQLYKDGEIR